MNKFNIIVFTLILILFMSCYAYNASLRWEENVETVTVIAKSMFYDSDSAINYHYYVYMRCDDGGQSFIDDRKSYDALEVGATVQVTVKRGYNQNNDLKRVFFATMT